MTGEGSEVGSEFDAERNAARKRDRKFWIALSLFGVLAAVSWFSFGDGTVFVFGRQVQLRVIPLFILGTFVFRTVMAREADKIRRGAARDFGPRD